MRLCLRAVVEPIDFTQLHIPAKTARPINNEACK